MNRILTSIILIMFLLGCAAALDGNSGVETQPPEAVAEKLFEHGIGQPWVGGNPPSASGVSSQYSQYYTMHQGPAPKTHIETPRKYETKGEIPTTIYFGYQMQSVPYSQYQNYATYTGGNSLWIQGATSWTQYAKVPQGASLSLLAISSAGGNSCLFEIKPDGRLSENNYYFFSGYNQMDFYADSIGQHILLFVVGDQVSNAIVIDVAAYYPYPSLQQITTIPAYPPTSTFPSEMTSIPIYGNAPATIISKGMSRYQVFLDGNHIGTERTGGEPRNEKFSFGGPTPTPIPSSITGYSYKDDVFCANHYSAAQLDAMKAAGFLPVTGPITKCVTSYVGIGAPLSAYIPRSIANVIRMYKDKGATPIYG